MILEALVTTVDPEGDVNLAPMGPAVTRQLDAITLKPFVSSQTYRNLRAVGKAVVHVTDDAALIGRAAIRRVDGARLTTPLTEDPQFHVLDDCCRWFAVRAVEWNDDPQRPQVRCEIVRRGRVRDFFGFNRAAHAVLEAAILATRTHLLEADDIARQLDALQLLVEKTGETRQREVFDELRTYCREQAKA